MAEFQNTIDLLGDEVAASYIADRSIVNFSDDILNNVGKYAFSYCSALTSIDLPNATRIDGSAFYNCSALASVHLPNATSIDGNAFQNCSALTSIDLPNVTSIGHSAFYACGKLSIIILRSETLCTLSSTSTLYITPFASGGTGGTVYVPQALIELYQTATNWSTLYAAGTCNFVAIEGSEYE